MDLSGLQNTYSHCLSRSPRATGLAPASSSVCVSTFRTAFELHTAFVAQVEELCSLAFLVGENRSRHVNGVGPNSWISGVFSGDLNRRLRIQVAPIRRVHWMIRVLRIAFLQCCSW